MHCGILFGMRFIEALCFNFTGIRKNKQNQRSYSYQTECLELVESRQPDVANNQCVAKKVTLSMPMVEWPHQTNHFFPESSVVWPRFGSECRIISRARVRPMTTKKFLYISLHISVSKTSAATDIAAAITMKSCALQGPAFSIYLMLSALEVVLCTISTVQLSPNVTMLFTRYIHAVYT